MTDLDHDRVKDVFLEACLRPPSARQEYLTEACAGSDGLFAKCNLCSRLMRSRPTSWCLASLSGAERPALAFAANG